MNPVCLTIFHIVPKTELPNRENQAVRELKSLAGPEIDVDLPDLPDIFVPANDHEDAG